MFVSECRQSSLPLFVDIWHRPVHSSCVDWVLSCQHLLFQDWPLLPQSDNIQNPSSLMKRRNQRFRSDQEINKVDSTVSALGGHKVTITGDSVKGEYFSRPIHLGFLSGDLTFRAYAMIQIAKKCDFATRTRCREARHKEMGWSWRRRGCELPTS